MNNITKTKAKSLPKKESESKFQSRVIAHIRKNYPQCFIWKASDRFIAGIPDIMGICDGHAFGIELKVGNNKPTKLQEYTHEQMRKAGADVAVCWELQQVISFLDAVTGRNRG